VVVVTRNEMASALGLGLIPLVVLPSPDGAIDQADAQHALGSFAGIIAGLTFSYDFVEFADVSVTAAYFDDVTLEPD
jgi:hypothetical protein